MGIHQTANDLEEIISGRRPFSEDTKSVKQMLIEKGEWTDEDEEEVQDDYLEYQRSEMEILKANQ